MSISIGIDVAKLKLDIWVGGKNITIPNEEKEIQKAFENHDKDAKIVMEATGIYHRLAHHTLHKMGFKVMVINPYQSRHFAKAMNVLCKTDAVDAKILSLFAEKMDFTQTVPANDEQVLLQDLSRHLDDLNQIKLSLDARLKQADDFIHDSLCKAIRTLAEQIVETEKKLEEIINKDTKLKQKCELLETIPGVGRKTAIFFISGLKEMGIVNSKQIAALCGVAPVNNDSGGFQGKRRIRGGRFDIRKHLYMPVLGAATRHNAKLKAIYTRLIEAGKPAKVALTACMRKLVIWANAILASGKPWEEKDEKILIPA